ncbi:DUF4157 domain-containing protein [Corallococcus sp. ZKHCc1 1396]|uniref:DUF4157 domain-containing protein n=1 Tax=Corallococcus soli TaxID=2710757 RepID=A0ABR9PY40_9BACT|nr:DUF4157 domain-containing protein [Corallococcus soli]MBE4752828.1 DUF4157 domain-containing protein [Corallococcus soli]
MSNNDLTRLERQGTAKPLPLGLRRHLEAFFAEDFSDVRVHLDARPLALGAWAFTHGTDIHFVPSRYRPGTEAGVWLLAHELAHVVQQRRGDVPDMRGGVLDDAKLEAEADRLATLAVAFLRGGRFARGAGRGATRGPGCTTVTGSPSVAIQCFRVVRQVDSSRQEVEFSRKEPQPVNGLYKADGYYYSRIAEAQTTILYERSKTPYPPEPVVPPPQPGSSVPYKTVSDTRHLRAEMKKSEALLHQRYLQLGPIQRDVDQLSNQLYLTLQNGNNALNVKLRALHRRLQLLQRRATRSAFAELRAYITQFESQAHLPLIYRLEMGLPDAMNGIIGGFRARSMPFVPSNHLLLLLEDTPKQPHVGEDHKTLEERFDVLARKSGAPPKIPAYTESVRERHIHEVDLAMLPTQGGLPIDRVRQLTDSEGVLPTVTTVTDAPPGEKAMAIGFQGAIDFGGELTVGNNKATRIYGLLFPKDVLAEVGVKMRDEDSPNLTVFSTQSRRNNLSKLFSIRYEKSTAKDGQAHLHDDWLLELDDGTFINQTEYLRQIALGVVELRLVNDVWVVRKYTTFGPLDS